MAESTLLQMVIPEAPENLIGDNAYDSDKLDAQLRNYEIELISRTAAIAKTERKIQDAHEGIVDVGRSKGCLPC